MGKKWTLCLNSNRTSPELVKVHYLGWGFGSCHSVGVAGVCAAMACAKSVGQVEAQSSKKCEGSAVLFFNLSHVLIFSKSKLSAKPFTCPRWKSLFSKVSSVFWNTNLSGPYCYQPLD
jgi:hypothetical protein